MKRTKTMRMAAVLLALVLITSCFVGNTFAKYVTSEDTKDTARVAKFGVTIEGFDASEDGLFKTTYVPDDDDDYSGELSVESSNDDKLLAPGTKGTMAGIQITGKPEVAVRISFVLDEAETYFDGWEVNDGADDIFYCPLIFTIGTDTVDGKEYADEDELIAALAAKIEAYSADLDPLTDLSDADNLEDVAISWEWPFEDEDEDLAIIYNDYDTQLGDAATAATVGLAFNVSITQID